MTHPNVAIQAQFVDAVLTGQLDRLDTLMHRDFVLQHASTTPYAGDYRGKEGFLRFLDIFMSTYELERLEPVATFVSDDGAVVGELVIKGAFKDGRGRVDTTMLEKWEFEDGKVIRIRPHYFDPNPE